MAQKITLGSNGVVQWGNRMQPKSVKHSARVTPAVKLTRLHHLLKTQKPNICIVRGEGIGDVIMTTPTVHAVREMFDQVDITFATNTRYLGGALVKVLQYNPDISHIVERDLMDDLDFDLIINLHCPAINYERRGKFPPNRIDLFANHAGVVLKDPVPKYYLQKEEVESGEVILKSITVKDRVVLVQPFSSSKARNYTHGPLKEALTKLYNQHGVKSVIVTHSSDGPTDTMWDNLPGSIYARDLDIRGIAGLMVHCNLVLCPDSSVLHLAGALGVPTVSLFGPTPPSSRINHYKNAVAIWEGHGMGPCPCWYEQCNLNYTCWKRISSEMIVEGCVEHLRKTSKVDIVQLLNHEPIKIETEVIQ